MLSAVAKVINGRGIDRESNRALVVEDICRHCSFDSVSFDAFPNIGIKIQFEGRTDDDNFQAFMTGLGQANPTGGQQESVSIFLDGLDETQFATIYSASGDVVGQVEQEQWYAYSKAKMPLLQYIDAKLMINNEIYIDHLLSEYSPDKYDKSPIRLHTSLNDTADEIAGLSIPDNEEKIGGLADQLVRIQREMTSHAVVSDPNTVRLEKQLFFDVLEVSQDCIERIRRVGWSDRGYMELVLSDINRRIEKRLDLSHVWTQDEDIALEVDYKGGFFYFHLRDKTGCKFTFNERSSGLRYFMSYYIQSLAYKKANTDRGTIVLMDEPDGFLSAVAQRNLLRVFESLTNASENMGRCQLLYTTHSPFLVNRNFPQRVRLVRKGDGNEGTQFVEKSHSRRYEPIRSALGVDCAETIFMGATNVVLEGMADQKILVAALQKFGAPDKLDETIDLNTITFVSANGAPSVKRILQQTVSNDDKKPIFVVVLDGDGEGQKIINEIEVEGLADKNVISTLSDFNIAADGADEPKVLEDLIPLEMLASATSKYLKSYWNEEVDDGACLKALTVGSDPICKRLEKLVRDKAGADAKDVDGYEVRGGITDAFIDSVLDSDQFAGSADLTTFQDCLLYTSPSPRDQRGSRMPSSA